MKVFVAVYYDRNHETRVCGVSDDQEDAKKLVESAANKMLYWSKYGSNALDEQNGDCVGHAIEFDVFGKSNLKWEIDSDGNLSALSAMCDEDNHLVYTICGHGESWNADFEGADIASGTLEYCMSKCRKHEDKVIDDAKKFAASGQKHGKLLWMLKRFLDPEDLGRAVNAYIRDEVREVLGMNKCESKTFKE